MEIVKLYEEKIKCENCILELDKVLNEIEVLESKKEKICSDCIKFANLSKELINSVLGTVGLFALEVTSILLLLNKFDVDINYVLKFIFSEVPYIGLISTSVLAGANTYLFLRSTEEKRRKINKLPNEKEAKEKIASIDSEIKSKEKLKDYCTEQKAILVGKVNNLDACLTALNQVQMDGLVLNKGAKVKGGKSHV